MLSCLLSLALARRTHRRFADEPVPDALVDLLLYTALSASSKSDFQQASVIKVRDPEKRTAIAHHFPSMPWIETAPVFLAFCADARRLDRISSLWGHLHANRISKPSSTQLSMPHSFCRRAFCVQRLSGSAAAPSALFAISCRVPSVPAILKLSAGVFPIAGLCLGYPSGPSHMSMRLPPSLTIHTDACDDSRLAQEIEGYDRRRDGRNGIGRDQQRNLAKFGYADFYGWSEDKARQAAEPEGAAFASHVKQTWFSS